MRKFSINNKILFALLSLSILSLILFAYIASGGMRALGKFVLKNGRALGHTIVSDSISSLGSLARRDILSLAKNQAALSEALLERIESEVSNMAEFASSRWKDPPGITNTRSYSQKERPEDIYAASVYMAAPGADENSVAEDINISLEMDRIFIPVLKSNPNINTICMGTEEGAFRSCPWRSDRDPSYDPRKREWYKRAVKENGLIWSDPYIHASTKDLVITCAKPFYGAQGELKGVVEADVTIATMSEKIISTQVGKSGYVFLIDSYGNIIARPELDTGDTGWDETYNTKNLLKSDNVELVDIVREMIEGGTGVRSTKFNGGEKYIAYAPISGMKWSLGIAMPVQEIIAPALETRDNIVEAMKNTADDISARIGRMQKRIFVIFVGILFIVFTFAYWLSRKITRPVLSLSRGAKIMGSGNLDHHLDVRTGDEIEDLSNSFNKMASDLKIHIKELTETTVAKEKMEKELKIARDIQMSIVPKIFPPFPDKKEFDIYAILDPAKEVGGDFYDFFFLDKNKLCFIVGDVSGKGVPASLFMAVTITLIRSIARDSKDAAEILSRVNNDLSQNTEAGMFVTIFCGILDIKSGKISFANGGHNPPLVVRENGDAEFLESPDGMIVGAFKDMNFDNGEMLLTPNDTIFMYTDGVTEAFNENREMFSEDKLLQEMSQTTKFSVKRSVEALAKAVSYFASGMPQSDDITIMALRYTNEG